MTRRCPACGSSFPDEVFFCGHDGTITVQEQDRNDYDPRLGQQLGQYVVVARVADGAMGRVYEGRHPETKARTAIKVLHADVAKDDVAVERFKREYETAQMLDHPHVVHVLELGETDDGSWFMTMEYLEGEELGQTLRNGGALPPERMIRIATQLAQALDHAHSYGVIHRDLKPDNVFLCRSEDGDVVRVLDFGSVKLQMETGPKLTAFGTTLGSPYYMSPEQAMGKQDVDQRTDVFAMAAILWEMATGRVAFEGANVAEILMKIVNETPPPASAANPSYPPAFDDVVDKGIRKDKSERYASASELGMALTRAFGLEGSLEQWGAMPMPQIAAALSSATPAAPKPFGAVSAPPPGSSPVGVYQGDPGPSPGYPGARRGIEPLMLVGLAVLGLVALGGVVAVVWFLS